MYKQNSWRPQMGTLIGVLWYMVCYAEGVSDNSSDDFLGFWNSQPAAACGCCVPGVTYAGVETGTCGVLDDSKCPTSVSNPSHETACCAASFRTNCGDSLACIMFDNWCSRFWPFLIFLVVLVLGCVYFFMKHRKTRGQY